LVVGGDEPTEPDEDRGSNGQKNDSNSFVHPSFVVPPRHERKIDEGLGVP
jgi:hypothetical protein